MDVSVNGEDRSVPEDSTLLDLIETLGYGPRQVVAERNGDAVERARFGEIVLAAGDRIEIVRAVAGGGC